MKNLLNSRLAYLLFPIYLQLILLFAFMNVPLDFLPSLLALPFLVTLLVALSYLAYRTRFNIEECYLQVITKRSYRTLVLLLSALITISMPFDILINGFKILNPETYAEIDGYGRYVRHISSLCWILIPVAFIFIKNTNIKRFFIILAILFPILIVDRNRLFIAFYSLIFCVVMTPNPLNIKVKKYTIIGIVLGLIVIFGLLGQYRSGDAFFVESSGESFLVGSFPLKDIFYSLPQLIQQIVLYLTTPLLNFATILNEGFENSDFLFSQLSPFARDEFDVYTFIPILVARYNVGTEYFPWLLYGGFSYVALALFTMVLSFFSSHSIFKKYSNIFTFLIFIKISYVIVFAGFAPQFYLLMNLLFILLMLLLWALAKTFSFRT